MAEAYTYILECKDGSLYTGWTNDLTRRVKAHNEGRGAKYTRSHPPARLLGYCSYPDRSTASRAEYQVKQLSPARKRDLCTAWLQETTGAPA